MNKIGSNPQPVKLFIGMLSNEVPLFDELKGKLKEIFGPLDLESPVWEWSHTDYYSKEMGEGLKRKFIFFQRLISPENITAVKLKTIELEGRYRSENPPLSSFDKGGTGGFKGGRRINLDPGYLDMARVVLVSTKDYSHRIYLGEGIYGEVTLIYSGKDYQTLPYTYPDFRIEEYRDLFKKARNIYRRNIMEIQPP